MPKTKRASNNKLKSNKAAKTSKCPKWNGFDDAKLKKLFDTGAVDLKDICAGAIHSVIEKYFPERPYDSFSQLYKRKLRQFNIERTKSGARKGEVIFICCVYNFIALLN